MKAWGSTAQEELASVFGRAFKKKLRWPTPYFLPKDKFAVIAHGPKFDMIDNFELEEVIEEVENYKGNRFPLSFWQASFVKTLGEVVNEILGMQDGA